MQLSLMFRGVGAALVAAGALAAGEGFQLVVATTLLSAALLLCVWMLVPESVPWLVQRGCIQEALRTINALHTLTPDQLQTKQRELSLEHLLRGGRKPETQLQLMRKLLRVNPGRTAIIMFAWLSSWSCVWGVSAGAASGGGRRVMAVAWCLAAEAVGWALSSALARASRRASYCVACALAGVLCLALAQRRKGKDTPMWLLVVTKLFASVSWWSLPVWAAELLPTPHLPTAFLMAEALSRVVPPLLAPFIVKQGVRGISMSVLGGMQLASGVLALLLPERGDAPQHTCAPLPSDRWAEHACARCHPSPQTDRCSARVGAMNMHPLPESPIFSLLHIRELRTADSMSESSSSLVQLHVTAL